MKMVRFYLKINHLFKTISIWSLLFSGIILSQQEKVEKILNRDGTIKPIVDGSYDASGYTLTFGKNDEPIFKKASSNNTALVKWSVLPCSGGSNGVSRMIYSIAVNGTDVYAGGAFTQLGDGTSARYIAKWNGTTWSNLPCSDGSDGVDYHVHAIAVSGTDLYIGGDFTQLGDGTSARYIAKWNGTTWSNLPCSDGSNGVNGIVKTIAVSGSDIFVGGAFTQLGDGTSAKYIAKWNGATWSNLPCSGISNGVNGNVNAVTVNGTDVYVGGDFTQLGDGKSAKSIAKWNGTAWSNLPCSGGSDGVNYVVYSIAVSGSDVFVGGDFTQLGDGTSAKGIIKWNGTTWSNLPCSGGSNGVNYVVYSIAVDGTDVYIGGDFTQLGDGTSAHCIAKWNGNNWSTLKDRLSNGVDNAVRSLTINYSNHKMYIGGDFTSVGFSSKVNNIASFSDSDNPFFRAPSVTTSTTSSITSAE
jgi:trimeric autotransporter adhesin